LYSDRAWFCLQPDAAALEELPFGESTDDVIEGQSAVAQRAGGRPQQTPPAAERGLSGRGERRHGDGLSDAAATQGEVHQGDQGGAAREGGEASRATVT